MEENTPEGIEAKDESEGNENKRKGPSTSGWLPLPRGMPAAQRAKESAAETQATDGILVAT